MVAEWGLKMWCVYGVGGDDPGVMKAGSLTTLTDSDTLTSKAAQSSEFSVNALI